MKTSSIAVYLAFTLLTAVALPPVCAGQRPSPVGQNGASSATTYLNVVIARVNSHSITRRAIVRTYLEYYPDALQIKPTPQHTESATSTDLQGMAPRIFGSKQNESQQNASRPTAPVETPAAHKALDGDQLPEAVLPAFGHNLFARRDPEVENIIRVLMQELALEDAAIQRHVAVATAEAEAQLHAEMERQRLAHGLLPMPDREIARNIGIPYPVIRRTVKLKLLMQHLTLADLNEQLGHVPQTDDFFCVHMILISPESSKSGHQGFDWEATQTTAESLRADILAGKTTFEATAKAHSADPTRLSGGNVGPMVRTLFVPEVEQAVMALNPGEITHPIKIDTGCVLVRLDKRGSELSAEDRRKALAFCARAPKRQKHVIARVLRDVQWSTTLGTPPDYLRQQDIR